MCEYFGREERRICFSTILRMEDRQDLIEDATDRLIQRLAVYQPEKEHDGLNPAGSSKGGCTAKD
jgi:hypothetical protein